MGRIGRWLGAPESVEDNIVGTCVSTVALVLVFKYVFGDSWTFALILALLWAPVAFVAVEFLRRRRGRRATVPGSPPDA